MAFLWVCLYVILNYSISINFLLFGSNCDRSFIKGSGIIISVKIYCSVSHTAFLLHDQFVLSFPYKNHEKLLNKLHITKRSHPTTEKKMPLYRKIILLLILATSKSIYAQSDCDNEFINSITKQLGQKTQASDVYCASKSMPTESSQQIIALAIPSRVTNNEVDTYDLNVVVARNSDHKILRGVVQKNAIESDAFVFKGLSIDTGRYNLTPNTRAFGVRISHEGSSHANPYSNEVLNLYVIKNSALKEIMNSLVTKAYSGEWDTNCSGNFTEQLRTIDMAKSVHNGYADLIINSTVKSWNTKLIKDDCNEKDKPIVTEKTRSQFDGTRYALPNSLSD